MAEKEKAEAAVDEHGLQIQRYVSMVLVVVPPRDYAETTLRYARSALYNVHVGTRSVSTDDQSLIKGVLQDEFQVDGPIAGETMEAYSGLILVGGPGALELAGQSDVLRLVREADAAEKMIAAWGHAALLLARAGVVKGRKVTGDPSIRDDVRAAGGKFTGVQVQRDRNLITAFDDAAGLRMGREMIQSVGI
jgi:putative intracellular protease/amidase